MTLTQEQVQALSRTEAEKYLKKFERHYPLDKPLMTLPNKQEILDQMDSIINTLLYLEDHIRKLTVSENIKASLVKETIDE